MVTIYLRNVEKDVENCVSVFSDADKVSLICGAINNRDITAAVETSNRIDPKLLEE